MLPIAPAEKSLSLRGGAIATTKQSPGNQGNLTSMGLLRRFAPRNDSIFSAGVTHKASYLLTRFMKVLYEDNHLIAVYKPHGVLVQGDKSGDECLMDEVKNFLKEKYKKPGNVFLGLLHRLDRPVAGIVLFAKTSKGASRLSEQFRNHTVEKVYQALVEGKPEKSSGTLINWLRKDKEKNKVEVFDKEVQDSQRAELDYEVIKSANNQSLLKVILKTGRAHQIRAQLSRIGCPIVGDKKYGSKVEYKKGAIALSAVYLRFRSVVGEKDVKINLSEIF
jgi:23S rRNA pseudouridine1911/1915/1917 synthase